MEYFQSDIFTGTNACHTWEDIDHIPAADISPDPSRPHYPFVLRSKIALQPNRLVQQHHTPMHTYISTASPRCVWAHLTEVDMLESVKCAKEEDDSIQLDNLCLDTNKTNVRSIRIVYSISDWNMRENAQLRLQSMVCNQVNSQARHNNMPIRTGRTCFIPLTPQQLSRQYLSNRVESVDEPKICCWLQLPRERSQWGKKHDMHINSQVTQAVLQSEWV